MPGRAINASASPAITLHWCSSSSAGIDTPIVCPQRCATTICRYQASSKYLKHNLSSSKLSSIVEISISLNWPIARLAVNSRCPRILWRGGIEELLLQLADLPPVPCDLLESHCTTHEPTKAPQTSSFRFHINLSIKLLSVHVIRLVQLAWPS
jgi:hypothetical protein